MTRYSGHRGDALRRTLAVEAARLMAEHGIEDYGLAKRKAAERYGTFEGTVLPSNAEVEAALQEHLRLFERDTHGDTLAVLRHAAVGAMELLAEFAALDRVLPPGLDVVDVVVASGSRATPEGARCGVRHNATAGTDQTHAAHRHSSSTPVRAFSSSISSSQPAERARTRTQKAWSRRASKSASATPCCSTHV